ncbi:MAG TPA: BrnT family toxin [Burkholderiales bacterium]|nr:BrnT family toxin [Burkholderiales bacterium]
MRFQYDPAKAGANLKKHGVSFADAEAVLEDPLAITMLDPDSEGENRFITIGMGSAGELLVVIYTERNDEYRIISARRTTRKEQKFYEN